MNRINVALLGMGTIGLELIRRTMHRTAYRYVALGDRSGVIAKSCGFTESELARLIELKKGGYSLAESEGQFKEYEDMARLRDCVHVDALVDATDAQTYELLYKALGDTHVVISNKNPVADVPYEKFRRLITKAKEEERVLDFGTTAGAGMRIPEIISQLGCDGVDRFTGCLSGTMSYVSQRINDGRPLSAALKEAMEPPRNYAEPDPRVDLGGEDFARKLVIVGRMCGRGLEKEMVEVDKLIPEELKTIPVDSLIGMLAELDLEIERASRRSPGKTR
jgi:aspartokinase/homoserine dehydrogenase 1